MADALVSGASDRKVVEVQLLSAAPTRNSQTSEDRFKSESSIPFSTNRFSSSSQPLSSFHRSSESLIGITNSQRTTTSPPRSTELNSSHSSGAANTMCFSVTGRLYMPTIDSYVMPGATLQRSFIT